MRIKNPWQSRGIAALPAILLVGGIITELVLAAAVFSFAFQRGGFGIRLASEALSAAQSGADDAAYRVIRGNWVASYELALNAAGTRSASVTVEKDPPEFGSCAALATWGCRYRIRSTGRAGDRRRVWETVLDLDPNTREVKAQSAREVPFQTE